MTLSTIAKNRIIYMYQTSFCNVNTNKASSRLREKLYLPIWLQNMAGKIGAKM